MAQIKKKKKTNLRKKAKCNFFCSTYWLVVKYFFPPGKQFAYSKVAILTLQRYFLPPFLVPIRGEIPQVMTI